MATVTLKGNKIENPKLRIKMGNKALRTVRQDKFDMDKKYSRTSLYIH